MPDETDSANEIPHEAQVTPAHVLEALTTFKADVHARFDTLEGKVDQVERTQQEAGLNGHTPFLKAFLEQYAATYTTRRAWQLVKLDIGRRFRWMLPGKHWIGLVLAGALGAVGWQIGAAAFGIHVSLP